MEVCPVEAICRDPEIGAKIINKEKCIGCRRCTYICPFGAISVDPDSGVAASCTLCGGEPKCVEFCPKDVLQYVRCDKMSISQRRQRIAPFLEYQKLATASTEAEKE